MAGYSISRMVEPHKDQAYVEAFFTKKNKDLYVILPTYVKQFTLRDIPVAAGAKVTILASGKAVPTKRKGRFLVLDLSGFKPGDLPAKHLAFKIENAGSF